MKKILKYLLALFVVLFVGYHSVYFKKLNEVQANTSPEKINTTAYSRNFMDKMLPPSLNKAVDINELINMMGTDPENTFKKYGKALGIGNQKYFLVKGEGTVTQVNENEITVSVGKTTIMIATEYVFGNSIRDASGLINMNEFDNTSDFNEVSAGINKIIREEVLPKFKKAVRSGNRVRFTGAIELNPKFLHLNDIEVTPVQLTVLSQ